MYFFFVILVLMYVCSFYISYFLLFIIHFTVFLFSKFLIANFATISHIFAAGGGLVNT